MALGAARGASPRSVGRHRRWAVAAGLAALFGAAWLRNPGELYLAALALATVSAIAAVVRGGVRGGVRGRVPALGATAALVGVLAIVAAAQRTLGLLASDWPSYQQALVRSAGNELAARVGEVAGVLTARARTAASAPASPRAAFGELAGLSRGADNAGVALYRGDTLVAWGGHVVAPTESLRAPLGVVASPFYVTLYATATRGTTRAVATAVVHTEPPADRLVRALDARVTARGGLRHVEILAPGAQGPDSGVAVRVNGRELMRVRPVPPGQDEARLVVLRQARLSGLVLLALALAALASAVWRRERHLAWRLVPLAVALGVLALAPLNALSNTVTVFDPAVYFARIGGAFTASVGSLIVAGALVVMGILLAARSRLGSPLWPAVLAVGAVALGPFLLRALSGGVTPPPGGVTGALWVSWEVAIFLAAAALLLIAQWAGAGLRKGRGLAPWVAPLLATATAFAGALVTEAPARWPAWYAGAWMVVVGALVITRRHRGSVLTAGAVAALAAAALTWHAGLRGRIAQASRDIGRLAEPDADVAALLRLMGDRLAAAGAPRTESALLRAYAASELAGAGYPVQLAAWSGAEQPLASVSLAAFDPPAGGVTGVITDAVQAGRSIVRVVPGTPGVYLVLAVPYSDGTVMTLVVAPRTRLIPDLPFNPLLGLGSRERGEAPYALTLTADVPPGTSAGGGTAWQREGGAMHGHRIVLTARGAMRAHIVVERRSLAALAQRGTLVVMLDLALIAVLWLITVLPSQATRRWALAHARLWRASYRVRLTGALFAFFVLPAAGFALWSYRQLRSEDRQARELLVQEMLRATSAGERDAGAPDATPLLLYDSGTLRQASGPLFEALAPIGRFVPPPVWLALGPGREERASVQVAVAGQPTVFGFRALGAREAERRYVIGAPARGNEQALDRRRRDLGILVLFATIIGAAAALQLSGRAARSLALPIGRLRRAALAIAAGENEPPLAGEPPVEFAPVFSAFRRMAADLAASRVALERAQRRTAAVLRHVASGVIAVDRAGIVSIANPRAEALLGQPLPPGAALSPELAGRVASFAGGAAEDEGFDLVRGGRQLRARLTRGGTEGTVVLTVDDVTELARAERVLAWGEMARQVAHEIKNPLTPIRLGVQHLRRARADARADFDRILDENVSRILAEIDRLDEIARSFSRYGAGTEVPPPVAIDAGAIARDVLALERLGESAVDWRDELPVGPLMALAREDELREVLLNLMENARLAGARRVTARGRLESARVQLEVVDDGVGMAPDVLPRIFEPHFSTRTSGSGLGLAISRQLVERWGGTIEITSAPGLGTTVRLELSSAAG